MRSTGGRQPPSQREEAHSAVREHIVKEGEMSLSYNKKLIPRAKELRRNMTQQEKHLWYDFLAKYPVRFQRQKTIGNFIVDFFLPPGKVNNRSRWWSALY